MGKRVKCKACGDTIESKSRHDWKACKCGAIYVDGGNDYLRVGWPSGLPEEHMEFLDEDYEAETIEHLKGEVE